MDSIDAIRINFSDDQLVILNLCLAFIMFGVALDIKISDFKRLFVNPKTPLVGLASEYILLPILTFILVLIFQPPASIALGMVLIACCPGGSVSNFMVHLSKSNAALSVLLTSITTVGAVIITPLAFSLWVNLLPGAEGLRESIQVSMSDMVKTIVQLIFIPVALGMLVNHYYHTFAKKIEKPVQTLSLIIFLGFVVFGIAGNFENIINYVQFVFWIVLIHNALAFAVGYYFAKLMKREEKDARAIAIETGIQNTGLGLIIVFNFFDGIGGMAIILAWWGIWHLFSGMVLATYWSRFSKA